MKYNAKLLINGEKAKQITFFMLSVSGPFHRGRGEYGYTSLMSCTERFKKASNAAPLSIPFCNRAKSIS